MKNMKAYPFFIITEMVIRMVDMPINYWPYTQRVLLLNLWTTYMLENENTQLKIPMIWVQTLADIFFPSGMSAFI
jgi:hypothetical protein